MNKNEKPDGRYYIGDKVYPLRTDKIYDYAYDLVREKVDVADGKLLVGIITKVKDDSGDDDFDGEEPDGELSYSITWTNSKTKRQVSVALKNSWWNFNELTNNQTEFEEAFKNIYDTASYNFEADRYLDFNDKYL